MYLRHSGKYHECFLFGLLNIFLGGLWFQLGADARQELPARLVVNPVRAQKWSTLNRWNNHDDRPALMRVEGVRYFLLFLILATIYINKIPIGTFRSGLETYRRLGARLNPAPVQGPKVGGLPQAVGRPLAHPFLLKYLLKSVLHQHSNLLLASCSLP